MRRRTLSLSVAVGVVLGLLLAGAAHAATAGVGDRLTVVATVDTGTGTPVDLDRVDGNRPLELDPDREVSMDLRISNPGDAPVSLRSVRLQSQVLGMTFFDYATRVELQLEGEDDVRLVLPLDVSELGGQATGLLPARLTLTGADRDILAQRPFPVEVRGSLWSTYGVFGLLVAGVTLVLLAAALVRLALGRLPRNRWLRASRFAVPGVGLGLTLTFTLSVLGVLVPDPDTWTVTVVAGGLLGLLAGYATPSPERRRSRERDGEVEPDQVVPLEAEEDRAAAGVGDVPDEHVTIVLPDTASGSPLPPRPRIRDRASAAPTDSGTPERSTRQS